ncbi:MAG: hypothetical protein LBR80_12970 [Deltaproteobacteria bacterium]|nr:hypothetical protein [Deltaproteobacteria bacterium]
MRATAAALACAASLLAASQALPLLAAPEGLPVTNAASRFASSGFLDKAARPEGAVTVQAGEMDGDEEIVSAKDCPEYPFVIEVAYPSGMGVAVDRALKARADEVMRDLKARGEKALSGPDACGPQAGTGHLKVTSYPYRVSSKVFSVLLLEDSYLGGAHPDYSFEAVNLLADGTPVTAARLFADPAKSLPLFWERVYRDSCAEGPGGAPSYYGGQECADDVPPLPDRLKADAPLDELGHAVLTSLGLTVCLSPYDGWAWSDGPAYLDISKDDLVTMGADPGLWD